MGRLAAGIADVVEAVVVYDVVAFPRGLVLVAAVQSLDESGVNECSHGVDELLRSHIQLAVESSKRQHIVRILATVFCHHDQDLPHELRFSFFFPFQQLCRSGRRKQAFNERDESHFSSPVLVGLFAILHFFHICSNSTNFLKYRRLYMNLNNERLK